MARMPGARWVPANDTNSRLPMKRWDIICIHTIVGHDPANAAHFSTGSDGVITQSRDTAVQSAANYLGNYRVIAIENEDIGPEYGSWATGDGHAVPGFTTAQKEAIARILVWCNQTHGIPLQLAPDSRTSSRGVAYHRQGIDGNWAGFAYGGRVSGGELWTTSRGKVCPGDRRITQLINEIIPRARVLAGLGQETDMPLMDDPNFRSLTYRDYCEKAGLDTVEEPGGGGATGEPIWPNQELKAQSAALAELKDQVAALQTPTVDLDALADKIAARLSGDVGKAAVDALRDELND